MVFEPITGVMAGIVLSAVGGEVVGRPTNALLDAVLRSNAEQMSLLKRIDQHVDDLLRGPFNAGLAWLDEARRPHRNPDERKQDLENARRSFIDAIGNEQRDPARNSVIRSYLAFTALADDDFVAAEDYLEDAHDALKAGYLAAMRAENFWSAWRHPFDVSALEEYFEGISDLRVALGANHDSVPRFVLKGWHLPGIRGRSEDDDEWLRTRSWLDAGFMWRARHGGGSSRVRDYIVADRPSDPLGNSRRSRLAADRFDLSFGDIAQDSRGGQLSKIWDAALPTRTNELVEVALGGSVYKMLHGTFYGGMVVDDWAIVARDMAAERRRGWPAEQKDALSPEVREALWSPTFTPKATSPFDEHRPMLALPRPSTSRYPSIPSRWRRSRTGRSK